MNLLVSYEWLKDYVDLKKVAPDEFAKRMSLCGPAVEKIVPRDADLEKIVVGKIKAIKPHPNADKLRLVTVDAGSRKLDLVCGGTNLELHQLVAVAEVGARVRWHGTGEPITMEAAEIRGVQSEGMICAANEIGLGDAFPHADREILNLKKEIPDFKAKPGTPLAEALGFTGDVVMDIEVTANRVDAMGMVGLAREASAILGKKFLWKEKVINRACPERILRESRVARKSRINEPNSRIPVTVSEKTLCPRYMAARVSGVQNGPSPWWMKQRLLSAGFRPISLLVDITNYVLLETAQPMHVFDAAKLAPVAKGGELRVRRAKTNETIRALDGKTYELDEATLVIADAEKPVAVAGVMGGEDTGVSPETTDIIFECATFDPVSVRKTARRLNLYSDSQLRFEKGLSTESVPQATARAIELTLELCGGAVGPVTDIVTEKYKPLVFTIGAEEIAKRIGTDIPAARQAAILKDLGFEVALKKNVIAATAPWWRDHDIEASVDLTEEIARIYGYGNIPPRLPIGALPPRAEDRTFTWEHLLKTVAQGAGLTEAYTYSFVSGELLRKASFNPAVCLKVQNPLSEEFVFMRSSLLPSLLAVVAENEEAFNEQRIFEVANAYLRAQGAERLPAGQQNESQCKGEPFVCPPWHGLPDEELQLACAFLAGEESWKAAKGFMEHVFDAFGIAGVNWRRLSEDGFWHPGRALQAFSGDSLLATVGEVAPAVRERFKIEGRLAMVESPLERLFAHAAESRPYKAPSPFPASKRDLAIVIDRNVEYGSVAEALRDISPLVTSVEWFDTYEGKGVPSGKKSLAMHLTLSSPEKTLTTEEVDAVMEKIGLTLKEKFGAEVR